MAHATCVRRSATYVTPRMLLWCCTISAKHGARCGVRRCWCDLVHSMTRCYYHVRYNADTTTFACRFGQCASHSQFHPRHVGFVLAERRCTALQVSKGVAVSRLYNSTTTTYTCPCVRCLPVHVDMLRMRQDKCTVDINNITSRVHATGSQPLLAVHQARCH